MVSAAILLGVQSVGSGNGSQCLDRLIGSFRLPIGLRVVARQETGGGPNQAAESFPEPGNELMSLGKQ